MRTTGWNAGEEYPVSSMMEPRQHRKYPINEDCNAPVFQTDEFRIWCMKVIPCTKRFAHDWGTCPFSHLGERVARRDPRTHPYVGIACPDMKRTGACPRGNTCLYAHNDFEYWLHPTRYRTQLCKDGVHCRRRTCFFAHAKEELRASAANDSSTYVTPEELAKAALAAIPAQQEARDVVGIMGASSGQHRGGYGMIRDSMPQAWSREEQRRPRINSEARSNIPYRHNAQMVGSRGTGPETFVRENSKLQGRREPIGSNIDFASFNAQGIPANSHNSNGTNISNYNGSAEKRVNGHLPAAENDQYAYSSYKLGTTELPAAFWDASLARLHAGTNAFNELYGNQIMGNINLVQDTDSGMAHLSQEQLIAVQNSKGLPRSYMHINNSVHYSNETIDPNHRARTNGDLEANMKSIDSLYSRSQNATKFDNNEEGLKQYSLESKKPANLIENRENNGLGSGSLNDSFDSRTKPLPSLSEFSSASAKLLRNKGSYDGSVRSEALEVGEYCDHKDLNTVTSENCNTRPEKRSISPFHTYAEMSFTVQERCDQKEIDAVSNNDLVSSLASLSLPSTRDSRNGTSD